VVKTRDYLYGEVLLSQYERVVNSYKANNSIALGVALLF